MKKTIKCQVTHDNLDKIESSNRSILSFVCPTCHNKAVYDTERDVYKVADVEYHDVCICDECGDEFWAEPQYSGQIKFIQTKPVESSKITESNDNYYMHLKRAYKNMKKFNDMDADSANIVDFEDYLKNHNVPFERYEHKKDNGCTIFYNGNSTVVSSKSTRIRKFKAKPTSKVNAANYGGAYDILPDQYFTREDIVDFGEHVCDHLNESYDDVYDIYNVEMLSPTKLHLTVYQKSDEAEFDCTINIDMRKIRKPRDLREKYTTEAVVSLMSQIDEYKGYGNRSETVEGSSSIIWPWKMVGKYADDPDIETAVGGFDEYDCMDKLLDMQRQHGELIWYSGYSDEDYQNGEYIGRDNFIRSDTNINYQVKNLDAALDIIDQKIENGSHELALLPLTADPDEKGCYIVQIRDLTNNQVYTAYGISSDDSIDKIVSKFDFKSITGKTKINAKNMKDDLSSLTKSERSKLKEIQDTILNTSSKYLRDLGWDLSDIADYLIVEVEMVDKDRVKVEVRCELTYEELDNLLYELDKQINAKFDSSAYFEPVDPGIAQAYIGINGKKAFDDPVDFTWSTKVADAIFKHPDAEVLENDGEFIHVETGSKDSLRAIAEELNIPKEHIVDSPVNHSLYIPIPVEEIKSSEAIMSSDNVTTPSSLDKRSKITYNGRKYSVKYKEVYTGQDADVSEMFHRFKAQISELHPYDDANYAWASISDGVIEYRDGKGELIDQDFYFNADDMDVENENWCDEVVNIAIAKLNELNLNVKPKIIHNSTNVMSGLNDIGYSSFQDPRLQPEEKDPPKEESSDEVIDVYFDDVVIHVNEDGSWDYEDTTYSQFANDEDRNGDWYSDEDNVRLDDKVGVVEKIDDLMEPQIPSKPGKYSISGHAELTYYVGISAYYKYYPDGSYDRDFDPDDAEVSYEMNKSSLSDFSINPIK